MRSILIVDDYPTAVFATKLTLGNNYHYSEANNGKEALAALKNAEYDIIVTDLNMPLMDGIEFTRRARRIGVHAPIIMMSTSKDETKRIEAYEAGISVWIQKPYKIQEIQEIVQKILKNEEIIEYI